MYVCVYHYADFFLGIMGPDKLELRGANGRTQAGLGSGDKEWCAAGLGGPMTTTGHAGQGTDVCWRGHRDWICRTQEGLVATVVV